MKKIVTILLALGLISAATPLRASDPGVSGFPFLKIDVENRSAAMGGTQLSSATTAMAVFTNPAVVARTNGLHVATGMTNWIADIRQFNGAVTFTSNSLGTFGISGVWMDYGSFTRRYAAEGSGGGFINGGYLEGGSFSVAEYALGLVYARPVTQHWQVGAHLKYAGQRLPAAMEGEGAANGGTLDRNRNGLLLDVGTVYYPGFHDLRFGVAMKNMQSGANSMVYGFQDLPMALSVGGAMDLLQLFGPPKNNHLTFAFDWLKEPEYQAAQHVGLELGLVNRLFLRGGYRFNDTTERLTAGFGINLGLNDVDMIVDYSYSSFGATFGSVHRIAIGFGM